MTFQPLTTPSFRTTFQNVGRTFRQWKRLADIEMLDGALLLSPSSISGNVVEGERERG